MVVVIWAVARTGTVLINNPTIDSERASSVGRVEIVVPNTTSRRPVTPISNCAKPACSTVFSVV
ncbi:hypothetical protein MYIN104542_30055 [Mycobacterium intermedium]